MSTVCNQQKLLPCNLCSLPGGDDDDDGDDDAGGEDGEGVEDYLCAKMHMVDLAGSERAKRTKAEGQC